MHPDEGDRDQGEEQKEATCPDAREIIERAKRERQDEAPESANHADEAANGSDVIGVVDGDMLEHRRLAEAHEEAEHEDRDQEWNEPHLGVEADGSPNTLNDVGGGRIGEHESADDGHREGDVHDRACPVAIRESAPVNSEQACRHRIESGEHAGRPYVEPIDPDQVARQPERERYEGSENEEVVQRETPDLDVPEYSELFSHRGGLVSLMLAARLFRVLSRQHQEENCHDGDASSPDLRDGLPPKRHHDKGGEELRHRGANVAGPEDAERGALLLLRIEFGDIGDTDRKGAAGNADAERRDQKLDIGVGIGGQEGCDCGEDHHAGEDPTPADLVSPNPEHDAGK